MSPIDSFVALFESMTMLTVCLWITGFVLFCVEFFQPMHGVAYGLGLGLLSSAFITRMIYGSAGEAFIFVLTTCLLMFAVHVVSLFTHKRGWLSVARIEKAGERSRKYNSLVGSIGVAITPIDLTGNVTINDVNLVVSSEQPIALGQRVRITKITPDKIMVEETEDSDNQ
ncbi:MAG: hypothetical protein HDT28_03085 [Clostridiales bacterium]|nr:hypothetical protein [Clostridiales bacterium]